MELGFARNALLARFNNGRCKSNTPMRRITTLRLTMDCISNGGLRGEFRPRQTRQLPRAVDLKGRFLFLILVKC
jgi:hypothetical protein